MVNILSKWKEGLAKTSKSTFGQIATLFGATEISPEIWDDLEALLIQADLGVETTESVLNALEKHVDNEGITKTQELKKYLRIELRNLLTPPPTIEFNARPTVILIVGVNGSGKTTSIAKLGHRY